MPSIKIKGKAQEVKSGFEPYDGPTPSQRGFYRAVIKKLTYKRNNKGSMGFHIIAELEAAAGDPKNHAQFDGYPMFIRSIITEGANGEPLKEGAQRNLDNFLYALDAGDDPNIVFEDGDVEEGVVVKKVGKRNPVGAVVNIDLGFETYEDEQRPVSQGVYKFKGESAPSTKTKVSADELEDEEDDLLEDDADDAEDNESSEYDERSEELHGMQIPALKKIAKELGVGISGTKDALVERILDAEFAEPEEDEADEDEEEDDLEDELDDELEDEEDDEERAAREEELAATDRLGLRRILKAIAPDFQVRKSTSDDELREAILDAEFGDETPF